jgi:hypothetical protein
VVAAGRSRGGSGSGGDVLSSWAGKLSGRAGNPARGVLRFAFYGRVSTEDWQDPVTSRARQLQQALMLAAGAGVIVAEFFDIGESRELPWARRPQAAALVAQLADPERGWDAVVIGEYEPAGTCSPGSSPAGGAGAGSNHAGRTGSPPTGAATATPAPPARIRTGRRTLMSARTRSSRTWPLSPSCSPVMPGNPAGRAADPPR